MKKPFFLLAVALCTLALPAVLSAVESAEPAKAPAAKVAAAVKTIPMYSRADTIDPKARTFTLKRKDGVEVKHVLTAATIIKQGNAPAKLEDIKVGDYVSGSRQKVSETEYTVIKITAFGPKAEKKPAAAKPAETKAN